MHAQDPGFGRPREKVSPGLSLRLFSPVYMYLVPLLGEKYFLTVTSVPGIRKATVIEEVTI